MIRDSQAAGQDRLERALDAVGDGDEDKASALLRSAKIVALQCPDLTRDDRKQVAARRQQELDESLQAMNAADSGS